MRFSEVGESLHGHTGNLDLKCVSFSMCVCEKAPTCQTQTMDLCSFQITKLFIYSYDDSPSWGTQ